MTIYNLQKNKKVGNTLLYMRIGENALSYATTGSKPYRTYIGQTNENSVDRLYGKQFYKLVEPKRRIIIGNITDKDVHRVLDCEISDSLVRRINPGGEHNYGSDELFEWYVPIEQAYSILLNCCRTAQERKNKSSSILKDQVSFNSRPYQEKFVDKFNESIGKYFLLAMKCRSGKTCSSYAAMNKKGYKSALVLCFYGSPIQGWMDDAEKFNFNRIPVLADNVKNPTWDQQVANYVENNINYALITTAQFFTDDKKNLNRLKKVVNHFDCIVLDECHFGGDSNSINKILDAFPETEKVLEVSATPYKAFYRYSTENIFIHSYADEQRAKKEGEEWAQSMPTMKLITYIFDCIRAHQVYNGYTADRIGNILSLNAPLVQNATGFYDETCVRELIRSIFFRENRTRHQFLLYYSKHIVASLPSNFSCVLFAKLLEEMNIEYKPLVINDGKTEPRDIINHCKKHDKTICLTYKGNVCGVTNPYWDTAIFLHDYPSAEDWIQFASRAGSVKNRNFFTVIDLSPNRAISSLYQMFAESDIDEEPIQNIIQQMIDFIDMNNFYDGCRKWTQEEIVEAIAKTPDALEQTMRSLPVNVDLTDEKTIDNIKKILVDISANTSSLSREEIQISDNSTFNKSNKIITRQTLSNIKKENKDLLKKIENIKNLIVNLVFISELDGYHVDNFRSLLKSDNLTEILEISADELKSLICDCKIFGPNSERVLNAKLSEVSLIIRNTLSSSKTGVDCDNMMLLVDKLFHAQQHRPIPSFLISEFYESLNEQFSY